MQWTSFSTMCDKRCLHSVAVLDGKLYACGGGRNYSFEVYSPVANRWSNFNNITTSMVNIPLIFMWIIRWQRLATTNKKKYDCLVVAHEDKLLAIGGSDNVVEVYDPCKNEWQIDQQLSSGLQTYFPSGGLISASCIQAWSDILFQRLFQSSMG